jgi:hypothetical protein
MLLHAFVAALGLAASVFATARPRDEADPLKPELIATPADYANATDRQSLVGARSLEARQYYYCPSGSYACGEWGISRVVLLYS